MGVKNVLKKGLTSGFQLKKWVGADRIKEDGAIIGNLFKAVFKIKKTEQGDAPIKETFAESMQRLCMTEEDLKKRMKNAVFIIFFSLALSTLIFIYMLYLISTNGQILPGIVCFMLMFLVLTYALREHFYLFQMKQRRLGCTLQEYLKGAFKKSLFIID